MKVAQLFEPFPNPKNSPLGQKKEVKMSQKSSQNQKLKLKKRLKIKSIHNFLPPWIDYGYNIYIVSFGRYTNSKLLRFFTHNICAGDIKRLTSSKLF